MENHKKSMPPILVIILFGILISSFRVFLLPYIIEPVTLLLWALWRVVTSVDQNIYWILLIVICAILVVRIIPSTREETSHPAYNSRKKSLNRVEHWQKLIKEAALGKEESTGLRDNLENLLATVVAQNEQSETTKIKEAITKGEIPLPLSTQKLLFPQKGTPRIFSTGHKLNLLLLGPRWLRRWTSKFVHQNYTLMDETLRWMEVELEINDEN